MATSKPTKKNLRAFEKTVYGYEKSIYDLESGASELNVMERWKDYGHYDVCKLCRATTTIVGAHPECEKCILDGPGTASKHACAHHNMAHSYGLMEEATKGYGPLLPALKKRLKALLKRADKNGYELIVID